VAGNLKGLRALKPNDAAIKRRKKGNALPLVLLEQQSGAGGWGEKQKTSWGRTGLQGGFVVFLGYLWKNGLAKWGKGDEKKKPAGKARKQATGGWGGIIGGQGIETAANNEMHTSKKQKAQKKSLSFGPTVAPAWSFLGEFEKGEGSRQEKKDLGGRG